MPDQSKPTTIYQEVLSLGIKHDHHASDLYLPMTAQTIALCKKYGKRAGVFKDDVDGKLWLDVHFAYDPHWN